MKRPWKRHEEQTIHFYQIDGKEEKPKRTIYGRQNLGKKEPKEKFRTHLNIRIISLFIDVFVFNSANEQTKIQLTMAF